jgi:protein-L-isoaspartate(D-aspartate) O-methyltransferase
MANFGVMRENMIDGQVLPNQITNRKLIAAMSELPREVFVTANEKGNAYSDKEVEIGLGRFLLEPRVLAGLVQALSPTAQDVGLDVGCGTGYGMVILSKLCSTVVGIESDLALMEKASTLLTDLEIDNALAVHGALCDGYLSEAPYDVVLMEGAVPEVPEGILGQLADGGRLAVVVSQGRGLYEATLITRVGNNYGSRVLFNSAAPALPGFDMTTVFAF